MVVDVVEQKAMYTRIKWYRTNRIEMLNVVNSYAREAVCLKQKRILLWHSFLYEVLHEVRGFD